MKIEIDSNDLPAATRLNTWRGMLSDTYIGMDCHFPGDFRSVIEGHAVGGYTITRITSSRNTIDRSRTLIRRDGLEVVFFGALMAGRAMVTQGGREADLERGAVVLHDSSRPFRVHVDDAADIVWLSVPKASIARRVRGIEDLVAVAIRPAQPFDEMAIGLMAGLDEAMRRDLPAHESERLTTGVVDLLAMSVTSAGLPSWRAAGQ